MISGFLAATLVAFMPGRSPVLAASCNGASHTPTLSRGAVSPSSGTPSTGFTFSVLYSDTGGCAPTEVVVRIPGVGTYALTGNGSDYERGVVFRRTMTIGQAGTHAYSFRASSGSGPGAKTTTLSSVSPASFTVRVPSPTPRPTPVPTPRPTVPPTRPPTPVPTPLPTNTPPPTPSATSTATGTAAVPSTPTGTVVGVVPSTSFPTTSPAEGAARSPRSTPAADAAVTGPFDAGPATGVVLFVEWLAVTTGGLGFFMLLATRRGRRHEPAAEVPPIVFQAASEPSPSVTATARRVPEDEANMPRWLRPSVQAARQGRFTED